MSVDVNTTSLSQSFPKDPIAFKSYKIDYQQSVKRVDYDSVGSAVDFCFNWIKDIATRKQLEKINNILSFSKTKADKAWNLQRYLVSNFQFKTYRYSHHVMPELYEPIVNHLSKADAFDMVQLLDAYRTKLGYLQPESKAYINKGLELQKYADNHPKKSVSEIQKQFPKASTDKIKDAKKGEYSFTERSEIEKIVRAKLYLLTANHKRFTFAKKNANEPRTFTAFTQLSKVYRRHELCFQLKQFDIKSANAQFIDKLIGSDNYSRVYENLMVAYGINRDKAKVKFNATLNNHRLTPETALNIYLKAGYTNDQAKRIIKLTSKAKGGFYRQMAAIETDVINRFISANFRTHRVFTVHDSVHYQPEFIDLQNPNMIGTHFESELTPKAELRPELQQDVNEIVLTRSGVKSGAFKEIQNTIHETDKTTGKEIYSPIETRYKADNFTFYKKHFLSLNANFNINEPVYYSELVKGKKIRKQRPPTENEVLERFDKFYTILLYLNKSQYKATELFKRCIDAMIRQKGISFNRSYLINRIEQNNYDPNKAFDFFKVRDYTYHGKPLKNSDFQRLFHQEKGEMLQSEDNKQLIRELRKLRLSIKRKGKIHFISKSNFKRSNYTITHKLISEIYKLTGIKTSNQNKVYNKVVSLFATHSESSLIGVTKTETSQRELAKTLNINRTHLRKAIQFQQNIPEILEKIANAIENLKDHTEPEQLFDQPPKKPPKKVKEVNPEQHEYLLSLQKYYLHRWNLESQTVKTAYKNNPHPFLSYVFDQYAQKNRH